MSLSSKTGALFHSIKKLAATHTAKDPATLDPSADADFAELLSRFQILHTSLNNLRTHLSAYTQGMRAVLLSGQSLALDFTEIFEGADRPHPFDNQLQDLKAAHSSLVNSEKNGERYLNALVEDNVSRRVNEELAEHALIFKKIDERAKIRSEYVYYKQKMAELNEEKNKRAAKGKADSAKDTEKLDRNQQKLNEFQSQFEKVNSELVADMETKLNARANNYGPAMNEFVNVQKQFGQIYYGAVKDIASIEYAAGAGTMGAPPAY